MYLDVILAFNHFRSAQIEVEQIGMNPLVSKKIGNGGKKIAKKKKRPLIVEILWVSTSGAN